MISKNKSRHTKTTKAILDLYHSLPANIQDEIRELIILEGQPVRKTASEKNQIQEFYQWFEKNRSGLPAGYTFNREEANAR